MRHLKLPLVILSLFSFYIPVVCASSIYVFTDSTSHKREISKMRYFTISVSNDVHKKTDYYYTGGLQMEYVAQGLYKWPLRVLLLSFNRNAVNAYGVSLVIDAFTPMDILQKEVLQHDRPYAGYVTAGNFVISNQVAKNRRLTSKLNVGIIGPQAQTEDIQKQIHSVHRSMRSTSGNFSFTRRLRRLCGHRCFG